MKMQAIQPQLDKLRKKYEKDPQRLNTEQQKLMREQGVSMFGGCLPMLITMRCSLFSLRRSASGATR
jgi:YidC/Oxa1 family membrane protein insertase